MKQVVHAACPHDCPDACGVLISVENGKATKIQGDPAHPVTRGFLCAKVAKYLDRVYSPDRVLYPLRRIAPKGTAGEGSRAAQSNFQRISWDEALDEIASRFKTIAAEFGSESILPYSYAGNLAKLGFGSMDRRFFHRLGASQLHRNICAEAGAAGVKSVYGVNIGTEPEQFRHSKYIIAWAANIHGNNVHLWPFIEEARRNGAKLVVIDPYRTRTAACADWHIPINMGTDVALALAIMHVIINENLHDADYVTRYAQGFDELRAKVQEYPPGKVSRWTGISAADIRKLALEYATIRPAVIRMNYGIQRSENGGMAARTVSMLPIVTGSWKEVGGGFQLSTSGAFKLNEAALERADLMQKSLGRPARTLNMVQLGKALNEVNDPPVKALFVYNSNPGAVAPNHNSVIRGLARNDLFTVVHDLFFNDTTDYADYVLPATTFLEHTDVQGAYGHYFVQLSSKAIEPPGEAKPNVWLFGQLAQRMGFAEPCFRDTPEEMIRQALGIGVGNGGNSASNGHSTNPNMEHVTLEDLRERGHIPLSFHREGFLPNTRGPFATPSGRIEFYSETLAAQGVDGLPAFVPPQESRWSKAAERYPLEFLSRKADNYMNSTFANLDGHRKMEARTRNTLEMHPQDAQSRGIRDGDAVRIFNDRGSLKLTALVNGSVPAGVVAARLDWAKLSESGANVNALTSERLTDLGAGATFYSTLVEVEKV